MALDLARTLTAFRANLADHLASGHVVPLPRTLAQAMHRLESSAS